MQKRVLSAAKRKLTSSMKNYSPLRFHAAVPLLLRKTAIAAAASLSCLAPKAAIAQLSATPDTDCYIEWTAGVRTSLESLCEQPTSPQNTPSPVNRTPNTINPSTTRVEVVSEIGSTVYINGLQTSQPAASTQTQISAPRPIAELNYFQYPQTQSSRRYIQYRRFYPYPRPEHLPKVEHPLREIPLLPPGFSFRQRLF